MANMNRVVLVGRLTRNPEVRKTPAALSVTDLGLAITERYKNKAGETIESVCFVDVTVWGKQAEACGTYLEKGAPVLVEGRLQFDQWKNEAGENRSRLRVRADRVQFLGRPAGTQTTGQQDSGVPAGDGSTCDESPLREDLPF